jgi:DNA topoisomerase-3
VSLGTPQWRDSYIAQGEQKRAQIEQMIRYSQSSQCRMASLIRHFGDLADGQKPCGICDFCAPADCIGQRYRQPTEAERLTAFEIIDELGVSGGGRSVGKLHTDLCSKNGMSRDAFEELVGALARAGFVRLTEAVFEKDGKQIPYRKAMLTREADFVDSDIPLDLAIRDTEGPAVRGERKKAGKRKKRIASPVSASPAASRARAAKPVATRSAAPAPTASGTKAPGSNAPGPASLSGAPGSTAPESKAEDMLRAWRLAQAKRQSVPAFRIMSDKVLSAIASKRPRTAAELLAIPGIGIGSVEKYGAQIYRILNEADGPGMFSH